MVTSPAILVVWDFLPQAPPAGNRVRLRAGRPTRVVLLRRIGPQDRRDVVYPVTIDGRSAADSRVAGPFDADVRTVRWVAVLDPAGLRPDTLLTWESLRPCGKAPARGGDEATLASALIAQEDLDRWAIAPRPRNARSLRRATKFEDRTGARPSRSGEVSLAYDCPP